MANPISEVDIKNTSRCVFGLCYFILLVVFVMLCGCLAFFEMNRHHTSLSLLSLRQSEHIVNGLASKVSSSNTSGSAAQFEQLHKCLAAAQDHLHLTTVEREIKSKVKDLYEVSRSNTFYTSSSGGSSAQGISFMRKNVAETSSALEISFFEYHRLVWVFMILAFVLGALALASVPFANYFAHTRPLQAYAMALAGGASDHRLHVKPCSYGIVKLMGKIVNGVLEKQQRSEVFVEKISNGDLDVRLEAGSADDRLSTSLQAMQEKLQQLTREEKNNGWVNSNLAALEALLKNGVHNTRLSEEVIRLLSRSVHAGVGVLYGLDDKGSHKPYFYTRASYGCVNNGRLESKVVVGEGQLGELGVEKKTIVLRDVPKGYMVIHSGLGSSAPGYVVMIPMLFKENVYGALEFGMFEPLQDHELKWLEKAAESLAAHFFNQKINEDAKLQLQALADKQAQELVEIHRLQEQTYHKLELKLKEVDEERTKNEAILEGCVDAVVSFDEHGHIHFCNKAAVELFASDKESMLSKPVTELLQLRVDEVTGKVSPHFITPQGEKAVGIRTEIALTNCQGEAVDVLVTSTQVDLHNTLYFTFFMQKISVDLF